MSCKSPGVPHVVQEPLHRAPGSERQEGSGHLGDVGEPGDDEVQSLAGIAHAAQDENLLAHQTAVLAQLGGRLQAVRLAGHQETHQPPRLIVRIQLYLHSVSELFRLAQRRHAESSIY